MSELAVVGESKFILGFQLAGIQNTVETNQPEKVIEVMSDKRFGIVIIDQNIMKNFKEHQLQFVQESINPVGVILSEKPMEDDLRKMIIKSIGVDVWNR
ncbi:V-type ATP synthase subunit F [Nanoarchaeota archaeon]